MNARERLKIVIMQMVEHNKVHLESYEKWARFAKENQLADIGALLDESGKHAASASTALRQSLSHLSLPGSVGSI